MSINADKVEIEGVVTRLLDNLALTITSKSASEGANMRQQIGEVRANFPRYIKIGTFSQELLDCFNAAKTANVPLMGMSNVRMQLFAEAPAGEIAATIVQTAIGFCLSAESALILKLEFTSREDVEALIVKMTTAFNTARDLAADADNSVFYQNLTYLSGALISHLATVARPLPRMVKFSMPISMPALVLSNRIYYGADRWEEIVDENKIINPLFCPRQIVGMSS